MDRVLVTILSLAMLSLEVTAQENLTTVGDLYFERFEKQLIDDVLSWKLTDPWTEELEAVHYSESLVLLILSEFAFSLENVTAESVYDDLNSHCSEYLQTPIEDLRDQLLPNATCVKRRLWENQTLMLKAAVESGVRDFSGICDDLVVPFCSSVDRNCTRAYEGRVGELLTSFLDGVLRGDAQTWNHVNSTAPIDAIAELFVYNTYLLRGMFPPADILSPFSSFFTSLPSTDIFSFENLIRPWKSSAIVEAMQSGGDSTESHDESTWGIVKSKTGRETLPCRDSGQEVVVLPSPCYRLFIFQAYLDIFVCSHNDSTPGMPLRWSSSVSPVYFHSQCLCVASNGDDCGVQAPRGGVDLRQHCLAVLLRDFQRQVSYRPAVTYLDYAFQTPIPACNFSNFLTATFRDVCDDLEVELSLELALSVRCYLQGLVDRDLNCSGSLTVDTYDRTQLCRIKSLMEFVFCDEDDDDGGDVSVPFYAAGDSPLVLFLTYAEVVVRVLTLVTYLACQQLRNLPGKLLIGYLTTALVRLLVVQVTFADMALAVRLDVALDLSSTLWLTSYLHFLTVSIDTLRLPDSLSRGEARVVLLRYSLLGWVLPAALSTAFFLTDEAIDSSRVQFGQSLLVLCSYVALVGNLYMVYRNFSFYLAVTTDSRRFKQGVTARSVFATLFNFAVKTSVLSGAGIAFRLVFTQIQGLENLLGIYHTLGTLQGLLVFLLYGCNREARGFWLGVFRTTLSRFRRPRKTLQRRNAMKSGYYIRSRMYNRH